MRVEAGRRVLVSRHLVNRDAGCCWGGGKAQGQFVIKD